MRQRAGRRRIRHRARQRETGHRRQPPRRDDLRFGRCTDRRSERRRRRHRQPQRRASRPAAAHYRDRQADVHRKADDHQRLRQLEGRRSRGGQGPQNHSGRFQLALRPRLRRDEDLRRRRTDRRPADGRHASLQRAGIHELLQHRQRHQRHAHPQLRHAALHVRRRHHQRRDEVRPDEHAQPERGVPARTAAGHRRVLRRSPRHSRGERQLPVWLRHPMPPGRRVRHHLAAGCRHAGGAQGRSDQPRDLVRLVRPIHRGIRPRVRPVLREYRGRAARRRPHGTAMWRTWLPTPRWTACTTAGASP